MYPKEIHIAIFASGNGTNAENMIQYFSSHPQISVKIVLCNNPNAGVIRRTEYYNLPVYIISNNDLYKAEKILNILKKKRIHFIVLAGFLKKIPKEIIDKYKNKILNIHPALLPKFGGKGMYGEKVHKAVLEAGEKESGITIHIVNENYDEGEIIFQAKCKIDKLDNVQTLSAKVHKLEYEYYPAVTEQYIYKLISNGEFV